MSIEGPGGVPMVWCAHCGQKELEGTMAGDFLRLHIARTTFVVAVGEATGIAWLLRALHRER